VTKRVAEATIRLMVVHWHPVVLRGLTAFLVHEPDMKMVGVASTCEQTLDMAAELHPNLVLMGYSTPAMGGIEATRRLIELRPDTRVVLIGASDSRERVDRVLESGGRGYVLLETPPWELAGMLLDLFHAGDRNVA
jgi:two-component system, NarL family, nitrate/nitrite response regulator NarL